MVAVPIRSGLEPARVRVSGAIFKHFIVNSNISENNVIRAGEIICLPS
jgi:hypothetical protein